MTKVLKNYEKAYKDYKRGMSYEEIAKKYNTTKNTVKCWKRRHFNKFAEEEQAEKARKDAEATHYNAHHLNSMQALREMVEVKRSGAPPAFKATDTGKMISRISQYFNQQKENGKPCTRAGIILALGINKDTYYRYLNGEMDYLIEEHLLINHIDIEATDKIQLPDG